MIADRRGILSTTASAAVPWLLLLLIGFAFLAHVARYDFVSDDAFIALRYVRNLLEGHGLVYNPGERVEGFTSPLWVLLLATTGVLGLDLLWAARALGVLFGLLTLVGTFLLGRRLLDASHDRIWGLLPPALLAANGSVACWTAGGLETALFAATIVGTLLARLTGPGWLTGTLAGLCALARPEGLVVAAVVLAEVLVTSRRPTGDERPDEARDAPVSRIGIALPIVALAGGWLLFRLLYYGDLLPNTFYAKTGGGPEQWQRGWRYVTDYGAEHESLLLLAPLAALFLFRRHRARLDTAVVALALGASVIWLGGDGLPMFRFMAPMAPLLYTLEALVLAHMTLGLSRRGPSHRLLPTALAGVIVAALLVTAWSPPERLPYFRLYELHRREVAKWSLVGRWLGEHAPPGATLATVPIGAVGYYSGRVVYDMLGLTDRHVARLEVGTMGEGWAGHEKHDGPYILGRCPTYLLLNNVDVTDKARDLAASPFLPVTSRAFRAREADILESPLLAQRYRPRSFQIAQRAFLNVYEIRPEVLASDPACR